MTRKPKRTAAEYRASLAKARKASEARKRERGEVPTTVWLSKAATERLAKLCKSHDLPKARVIELALDELSLHVGVVKGGDVVEEISRDELAARIRTLEAAKFAQASAEAHDRIARPKPPNPLSDDPEPIVGRSGLKKGKAK